MKTFFDITDSKGSPLQSETSINELKKGESALIRKIDLACSGLIRRRLLDLGFVPGTEVTKLGQGLFNGPTRFGIRGNVIALREDQSSLIMTQSS